MGKMLKYLKESTWSILCIVALLILQAGCDLALPQYISDIVDVGIGQNGIKNAAPKEMRAETYENISLFLSEEEQALLDAAYQKNEAGNYELVLREQEETDAVSKVIGTPLVMIMAMNNPELQSVLAEKSPKQAEMMDLNRIRQMVETGRMTKEQVIGMKEAMLTEYTKGGLGDSMISQIAVQAVKAEYEAMGIDLQKMQMNYLWLTGGKMLLVAILMMTAAIVIGLLASRAAARLGMNLRDKMFKKVVSFSNEEMGQFSTAS